MKKNYTQIYRSLSKGLLDILEKYNMPPHRFTYTTSPIHKEIHNEILECIAKHVENSNDKDDILFENKKEYENVVLNSFSTGKLDRTSPEFAITAVIKTYLDEFYGTYYFTEDNSVKLTKKEFFDLPCKKTKNPDEFIHNEKYITDRLGQITLNPYRELTLLILPDGTCYNAQNNHLSCSRWLSVNGIDIDQAIRFESSKQFYDFNFCSLYNFEFSENSNDDELLTITDPQAIVITDLYKTLCNAWKYLTPLEDSMHNCKGFGFSVKDHIPEIGEKNLRTLDNYLGDFFSPRKYLRNLKDKLQEIERLERNQKETI